jgi:hypothetical protein
MSVTIRKIAQEVIRLESGGSPSIDSELNEGYVMLLVRQASNRFLKNMILENLSQDDRSTLPLMVVRYEVVVAGTDPNKYITLPDFYIHLPFNKGLRGVALVEDPTNEGIPRHNPGVSRNLPCADLEPGQFSYYTEGLKVYFDDNFEYGKVLLKLVVASPDSIAADDSLPIYPEHQADLIMMVRQMIANSPIQDKVLDNNADIGVKTNR